MVQVALADGRLPAVPAESIHSRMSSLRSLVHRLRTRAAAEDGVVLILVAMLLVVIIGCAALAIDVGSFYQAQRQAQSAADAGALAGSQDLPTNTTQALSDAKAYALKNDPQSNPVPTIVTSSTGATDVKVTVSASTPSFFGQFFGMTHANVSATAVAGHNYSPVAASIFADAGANPSPSPTDPANCNLGITYTGASAAITGGVVSNGALTVSTNPTSDLGAESYGAGCSGPTGATALPPQPYPIDYRTQYPNGLCSGATLGAPYSGLTIDNLSGSQSLSSLSSNTLYCDPTGTVTITANNSCTVTNVTFYVKEIVLDGNKNCSMSAPMTNGQCGLLIWATDTTASDDSIIESANNTNFCGTMFAPQSTISLSGGNTGSGFIEGDNVVDSANQWSVTAIGPAVGSNSNSLVQ